MTFDAFRCLRAMGDRADLFDLGAAQAEAAKVAGALLKAAVTDADKGKLRSIGQAIGEEAFDEFIEKVGGPIVSAAVDRIDGPATPKRKSAVALKRLKEIARGIEPPPPIPPPPPPPSPLPPIGRISLNELRQRRGPGLKDALDTQKAKAKAALKRLDPHFPGLAKVEPEAAVARLLRLAEGADPVHEVKLGDIDAAGLRRAHTELGEFFEPWLAAQKKPDLKAAVERIDPQRAKGRKPAASEHPSILREIAGGGALLKADDDVDPIGRVRFTKQDG